jgi:DNA-binding PadR family transcriptional regulator
VVLSLIATKPRHGYELIKSITETSGGAYSPSAGVIYPTLALLEDLGQVKVSVDTEQRKLHELTPEGRAFLEANRVSLAALESRLGTTRTPEVDAQIHKVRAAMDGLKQALRAALSAGPVSRERLEEIVATIEAAARVIDVKPTP